jgi:hypothetical protein
MNMSAIFRKLHNGKKPTRQQTNQKHAKSLGCTENLASVHLYTTYLETEELEGHFRRFLNDPELLKRLQ